MLPFQSNIIYIDIENGSLFGEIDFVGAAKENQMTIEDLICNYKSKNLNLVRQFTIQAIKDTSFLTITLKNL